MTGRLVADDAGRLRALERRAAAAPRTSPPQGAKLFRSLGCSGCHAPSSTVHAPDLHGVYGRTVQLADGRTVTADEAYLRDSILLPQKDVVAGFEPIMPSFRGIVDDDDMVKLIAYLKSLAEREGPDHERRRPSIYVRHQDTEENYLQARAHALPPG